MNKYKILKDKKGKSSVKDTLVFKNPEKLKPLTSGLAFKILKTIGREPMYPLEIAKKLDIHEQKVYYHIKRLSSNGLIEVVDEKEIKGATAKIYSPSAPAYSFELGYGDRTIKKKEISVDKKVSLFFKHFIGEYFNGRVVIGSPDPHGPLKAWARDGHYSNYLAMFLGGFINYSPELFVNLDVSIKAREKYDDNFILLGGPGVNMITLHFNKYFPVKYDVEFSGEAPKASFGKGFITSDGEEYVDNTMGVVQKIKNPFNKSKSVILFAGVGRRGTKSAVLSMTLRYKELLKNYKDGEDFYRIVQGFDLDGDGRIDSIEFLE